MESKYNKNSIPNEERTCVRCHTRRGSWYIEQHHVHNSELVVNFSTTRLLRERRHKASEALCATA